MAFLRDDLSLAEAVLALCDALDTGGTNAEARIAAVAKARKHAHAVIDRSRKKDKPADEPDGKETE